MDLVHRLGKDTAFLLTQVPTQSYKEQEEKEGNGTTQ